MREYKFRGWDEENKRMIYFGSINDLSYCDSGIYNIKNWGDTIYVDHCIKMQYIGKKDIKRKEVYESDIVDFKNRTIL